MAMAASRNGARDGGNEEVEMKDLVLPRESAGSIALSIEEACRLSSLGRTKLYELMNNNVIPAYKVGRRRLVLRDELDQALKSFPRVGRRS